MGTEEISKAEYERLSDQKAEDWRVISDVTPTLFGVAGAIFAAGAAGDEGWVVVLSPLPLFLGVFHMVRNAKLQLQMITYLSAHSPTSGAHWERDIAAVRPAVWAALEKRGIAGRVRRKRWAQLAAWLTRPSAWNTWLVIAVIISVLIFIVAALVDYEGWQYAVPVAVVVTGGVVGLIARQARTIEQDRKLWDAAWKAHRKGCEVTEAVEAVKE